MTFATLEKEIQIETPNTVGTAGKLNGMIAQQANSDIKATWAGAMNGKGQFSIITEDPNRVKDVLKSSEFSNYHEGEVVVVRVDDQKGALANVTEKIGNAGLNISYMFTTIFDNEPAIVVSTDDNQKAFKLFN